MRRTAFHKSCASHLTAQIATKSQKIVTAGRGSEFRLQTELKGSMVVRHSLTTAEKAVKCPVAINGSEMNFLAQIFQSANAR